MSQPTEEQAAEGQHKVLAMAERLKAGIKEVEELSAPWRLDPTPSPETIAALTWADDWLKRTNEIVESIANDLQDGLI